MFYGTDRYIEFFRNFLMAQSFETAELEYQPPALRHPFQRELKNHQHLLVIHIIQYLFFLGQLTKKRLFSDLVLIFLFYLLMLKYIQDHIPSHYKDIIVQVLLTIQPNLWL